MAVSILIEDRLRIPPIESLADFRRWALSAEFPETGRIDYIAGQIEVDMSPEDLYTHGTLKNELIRVLASRLLEDDFGDIFSESTRLSSPLANLSVEPDIIVVSNAAIDAGEVRLVPKSSQAKDRFVEIEGAPELVVEIISDSSVSKDTRRLPKALFVAGVQEFWLIDARSEEISFQIFNRGKNGFEEILADERGLLLSQVLNNKFSLERHRNASGRLKYTLLQYASNE